MYLISPYYLDAPTAAATASTKSGKNAPAATIKRRKIGIVTETAGKKREKTAPRIETVAKRSADKGRKNAIVETENTGKDLQTEIEIIGGRITAKDRKTEIIGREESLTETEGKEGMARQKERIIINLNLNKMTKTLTLKRGDKLRK